MKAGRLAIRKTDVQVAKNMWVSMGAMYNKKYAENSEAMIQIVLKHIDAIKEQLEVAEDVAIRICPIRKKSTAGRYLMESKVVELSCKWEDTLEVLSHELVHAEQHHQGRLGKIGKQPVWNDVVFKQFSPKDFKEYRNLPWEQEAFDRQLEIADEAVRMVSYYQNGFCGS